jgi:TRAP-type C4-dicarboxylate transport system permease small subunit
MMRWLKFGGDAIGFLTEQITRLALTLIVVVVLYNVIMRYVMNAPPYWSDRVGTSANIAMVLLGLSLTVRSRDLIAMQAFYELISPRLALYLDAIWNGAIMIFSAVFAWYGFQTAVNMPGQYWDFQDFCIDFGMQAEPESLLLTVLRLFEDVLGLLIKPFCVDGAVPQRTWAMLMPISGVLLLLASLGVVIEDVQKIARFDRND